MYSLLQHKFEQCIPFQRALLCSDQKLLHTVSSRFWGVADGSGTNEFGKILMRMREEKKRLWGEVKYKVSIDRVKRFTFVGHYQFQQVI